MNIKTPFKIISKPINIVIGLLIGCIFLFVLLPLYSYAAGFFMYIMEMLIVGAFVATVLRFPIHFMLKIVSNAKVREKLEIIIILLIIIVVVFLVFINIYRSGGFIQNFLYYLNDKIGDIQ